MTREELYSECHVSEGYNLAVKLQDVLDLLMNYYGNSPFGDTEEPKQISDAYRVMTNTIEFFKWPDDKQD